MTPGAIVLILCGLGLLVAGAELLVRGASRAAARLGVAPLIVGLTVVAMGTSAPEVAVSVQSALRGEADLALGNVVGSNIGNVLLILGLSALIAPLAVSSQIVRMDVPIMIAASLLAGMLALDGRIGAVEGFVLLLGMAAYLVVLYMLARRARAPASATDGAAVARGGWPKDLAAILGGLALLVLGARWLVAGAVDLAEGLGVDKLVIGLTVVAMGTSLPELATSIVATLRGQRDIAVGNVVGSNTFNLLFVLGLSACVGSDGVAVAPSALRFDLPVMIGVAVACLPVCFTGSSIARWEGGLFVAYFAAYLGFLVLVPEGSAAMPLLGSALLLFVMPMTIVTISVIASRGRPVARPISADDHSGQRGDPSD
jgi:cation:H+ antiporter